MSASSSPQGVPTGWDFFVGRWRRRARMGLRIVRHISDHGCYVNRDYLVLPDKKLIYAANCKVASSSIKSCLTGIQADNYRQVVQLTKKSDVYQRNINIDDYPGYFLFSFVRNPFSRLVSLYENKYHHDMSLDGHERVYPYFDRYLFGYLSKDRGFKAFAKRACGIPEWLADPHFASQVFILSDKNGRFLPDYVGKMEDLPGAFDVLRGKFGLPALPQYNVTGSRKSWMDQYDLKTAQLVYKRYKADIERFGYEEDYQKLLEHIRNREKNP